MCENQELCWHFELIIELKQQDCTIPLKRLRYSNRKVINSNITVTEALLL